MNDFLLEVKDLKAGIDGKEILKGINLTVRPGEVHAIMGPNGSGKSTFSGVLARIATVNRNIWLCSCIWEVKLVRALPPRPNILLTSAAPSRMSLNRKITHPMSTTSSR